MAKIESIRPGGTLEASFASYPISDLLMGILRGNLSGKIEIFLHPEPRNRVFFKDGVPISVELPDAGVSLVKILIESRQLPHDKGLDLLRWAEATGRSEEEIIRQNNLLSEGALLEAGRLRARAQMVRMYDVGAVEFRFLEGLAPPPDMPLTILQPLPVVYEGLARGRDRGPVRRFLEENGGTEFRLSATFPHGVDPFDWGEEIDRLVSSHGSPLKLSNLLDAGLSQEVSAAILMSLELAGMVERMRPNMAVKGGASEASVSPRKPAGALVPDNTPSPPAVSRDNGLMIHRIAKGPGEPREAPLIPKGRAVVSEPSVIQPVPQEPSSPRRGGPKSSKAVLPAPQQHDADMAAVQEALSSFRQQNYYQVLRISLDTDPKQLERAYRFLLRRIPEDKHPAGAQALRDIYKEAYEVLSSPSSRARYSALAARAQRNTDSVAERQSYEAEPKIDRAVRIMGQGRTAEATFLLDWAEQLDGTRSEIPVLLAMIDFLRAPEERRAGDARALHTFLAQEIARHPHDWRLKACQALVMAEIDESRGSLALLTTLPDPDHPIALLARAALRARDQA